MQVHVSALSYISLGKELTVDEKVDFAHSVIGPAMYRFSEGSYYSESEYSLQGNEWGERFWGSEIYEQLLQVKKSCRTNREISKKFSLTDCDTLHGPGEEDLGPRTCFLMSPLCWRR